MDCWWTVWLSYCHLAVDDTPGFPHFFCRSISGNLGCCDLLPMLTVMLKNEIVIVLTVHILLYCVINKIKLFMFVFDLALSYYLTIWRDILLSVFLGRTLRYGPMQLSTCPRSASCWTEYLGRCCCCWRPMTCWGASKPPYRPEPPPPPSSTCPAVASVP